MRIQNYNVLLTQTYSTYKNGSQDNVLKTDSIYFSSYRRLFGSTSLRGQVQTHKCGIINLWTFFEDQYQYNYTNGNVMQFTH